MKIRKKHNKSDSTQMICEKSEILRKTKKKACKKTLIESQEKYKLIADYTNDWETYRDNKGKLLYSNLSLEKITGYKLKNYKKGKIQIEDLFQKTSIKAAKSLYAKALKGLEITDMVLEGRKKNGSSVWVSISIQPVKINKVFKGFRTSIRDINDRKKAEEKLRHSEEKFKTLTQSSPDCIKLFDLKEKIIYMSPGGLKEYKMKKPQDAIGWDWQSSIIKKHLPSVKKAFKKAKKGQTTTLEIKHVPKNTSRDWILLTLSPVKDSKGKIINILGVSRDISKRKQYEKQLKESEKRSRDIALSSADWVWETDKNGKYTFASGKVKQILGYTPEELIGKTPFDLMTKEEVKRIKSTFQKIVKKKAPIVDLKNWNIHKNGKKIFFLTNGVPILDHKGNLTGYRGVDKDITKEKLAEEQIKESEEKHRLLYETSSDAIMTLAPPSWNFTSGNSAIMKIFGVKNEKEFISLKPWQLSPKYQPDGQLSSVKAKKMINKAMKEGQCFFEWTHKKLHGKEFSATVLLNQAKSKDIVFLQARVQDITESKKAAKALKESEEKYKVITKKTEQLIYDYDLISGKIKWDGATEKVLGYTKIFMDKKININDLADMIHPNDKKELFEALTKAQKKCEEYTHEYRLKTKNGEYIYVEDKGIFIPKANHKAHRALGTISNISERKETDKMKTEFVSVASHQLRTPLTSLKWSLEELMCEELGKLNVKQKGYIEEAYVASKRMNDLVNDLLNVARLEAGHLDVTPEQTNIIKLIKSVISEQTPPKKESKKYKILIKNPKKKLTNIKIDPSLIRQVLVNLVSNAKKYASPKKKLCVIKIEAKVKAPYLEISVSDNGIGIPKKNQTYVFEKFTRANNAKLTNNNGTGLGLYIAKLIIEASGGKIWLKSKSNHGSEFIFTLPLSGSKTHKGEKKLS